MIPFMTAIDLKDKVAIVTGAGHGTGKAIAGILAAAGARVDLGFAIVEVANVPAGSEVTIGLHGEHVSFSRSGQGIGGTVTDVRYLGEAMRCQVDVGATTLIANASPRETVRPGDRVFLDIEPSCWIALSK